jgi:hypothetical protein
MIFSLVWRKCDKIEKQFICQSQKGIMMKNKEKENKYHTINYDKLEEAISGIQNCTGTFIKPEEKDFGIFKRFLGQYVIVRAPSGIFAGTLTGCEDHDVIISNSRCLMYWDGAASLSELSQKGVSKPEKCQFPAQIPTEIITGVIEIIPCSEEAEKSIKEVKIWTEH